MKNTLSTLVALLGLILGSLKMDYQKKILKM